MQSYRNFALQLIRAIIFVDVFLMIVVGLTCLIGGWRTAYDYGQGLVVAGMIAIALGVSSVMGNYSSTRGSTNTSQVELNAVHASVRTPAERIKDDLGIVNQTFGCLLLMTLAGVSAIAIGAVIQSVAVK